jgi:AcrR family transcriptional regulator
MEDITKDRIIEKGRDKFLSMGFSKVTMDEIADELGISKKTLYKHFASKEVLLEGVIQRQMLHIGSQMQLIVGSGLDFIEKLHGLLTLVGGMLTQISRNFQQDLMRVKPELWKRIDQFRREKILPNFVQLLEQGAQQGMLRPDINKDIIILMFMNSVPNILTPEILSHYSFSMADAFRNIMKFFFEGVLTEEARTLYHQKTHLASTVTEKFQGPRL